MILNVNGTECEIIGYDAYVNTFERLVRPEYKGEAESVLLRVLETEDLYRRGFFSFYILPEKLEKYITVRFTFNCVPEESVLSREESIVVLEYYGMFCKK